MHMDAGDQVWPFALGACRSARRHPLLVSRPARFLVLCVSLSRELERDPACVLYLETQRPTPFSLNPVDDLNLET